MPAGRSHRRAGETDAAPDETTFVERYWADVWKSQNKAPDFSALARRELNVYGWIYTIETGEVLSYDFNQNRFVPLTEEPPAPLPPPAFVAEDHRH